MPTTSKVTKTNIQEVYLNIILTQSGHYVDGVDLMKICTLYSKWFDKITGMYPVILGPRAESKMSKLPKIDKNYIVWAGGGYDILMHGVKLAENHRCFEFGSGALRRSFSKEYGLWDYLRGYRKIIVEGSTDGEFCTDALQAVKHDRLDFIKEPFLSGIIQTIIPDGIIPDTKQFKKIDLVNEQFAVERESKYMLQSQGSLKFYTNFHSQTAAFFDELMDQKHWLVDDDVRIDPIKLKILKRVKEN